MPEFKPDSPKKENSVSGMSFHADFGCDREILITAYFHSNCVAHLLLKGDFRDGKRFSSKFCN